MKERKLMAKFNPGMQYQVVAVAVTRLDKRNTKRAVKKFAAFFNVNKDIEEVIVCAEWWGYSFGTSSRFMFIVETHSDYAKMAQNTPDLWDLAVESDTEPFTVLII